MPTIHNDLHGNVPDTSPVALLIIDMISTFEFENGDALFEQTLPILQPIADLRRRCKQSGIPVIYANDNYGKWRSDWSKLVEHCLESACGWRVLDWLQPDADDYMVLKPKQSGFFATTLEALLTYLKARTLILTGIAGDICVLFTAHDAYMRDYHLIVPEDCIASNTILYTEQALEQMERIMKVDRRPASAIDLDALLLKQWPKD
jgi:nicotinamidase-related amidase